MRTMIFLLALLIIAAPLTVAAQTSSTMTDEEIEQLASDAATTALGVSTAVLVISWLSAMVFACIPASIARSKGRPFFKWHVYGFWLFLIALIHSIAMPQKTAEVKMGKTHVPCPHCREPVRIGATLCPSCRTALDVPAG